MSFFVKKNIYCVEISMKVVYNVSIFEQHKKGAKDIYGSG